MKKIVLSLFKIVMIAGVFAGAMCACGGSATGASEQGGDSLKMAKATSEASSDLATFQLKGSVKSVTYSDDYYYGNKTFNFSADGELQCDSNVSVERDSLNRIRILLFPYKSETGVDLKYMVSFKYDDQGRVRAIRDEGQGWSSRARLSYDEKDLVVVDSTKSPDGLTVTDYNYTQIDYKGNWLSREYVSRNEGKSDSLSQEKGAEMRVITYY